MMCDALARDIERWTRPYRDMGVKVEIYWPEMGLIPKGFDVDAYIEARKEADGKAKDDR